MLPTILTNIADDDERAFVEKVYMTYEEKLFAISKKILRNHLDVQDCVNDTVFLFMKNIDQLRLAWDKKYAEAFITVVCRNCALNMARINRRKTEHEQPLIRYNYDEEQYEDIEIPDYSASVDKIVISEENCEYLYQLINRLDQKYRDVIVLKTLGKSNQSIAEIMHISEDLVRQRYSRAKKQLLEMGGKNLIC